MTAKRIIIKYIAVLVISSSLFSCGADCKKVVIEKVEWSTYYKDYFIDTLVSYSVRDQISLMEWSGIETKQDKHIQHVTIMNNNTRYSNRFAIEFYCRYGSTYNDIKNWTHTSDYVEIQPNSEYDFEYSWYGVDGKSNSDFDITIEVLQQPARISLKKRIDELKITKDTIDNCSCDVDALQAKYNAIKSVYKKLQNEHLIRTK
jgi:hypothetical protein